MAVHPSLPAKTLSEFIAYAKANPGKISMASAGVGSASQMSGELFKMMAGVNMVHVPYRGSPALTDLLSGQVQVDFRPCRGDRLDHSWQIAGAGGDHARRSQTLPDVPTMAEFLPGSKRAS